MDLLRFFTAGNVDDGKSTLIGRLLYDSNSISTDIIETLTKQSKIKSAGTNIDLALLTDGLRAEREQGITIDVAYKYFSTSKRKFIIADTPGHIQYTRNMFTGASNSDVAIILVDARNGITEQTKRHSILASLLGIPNVLVCVNKMDLVDYSENTFSDISIDYQKFATQIKLQNISFIPVSAYNGDNVVERSTKTPWYNGPSLLEFLETVEPSIKKTENLSRFQVQYVIRPQTTELHDYRGYAGKILSGSLKKGEEVLVLPSGITTTIAKIEKHQKEIEIANSNDPVVIHLNDDVDLSRGDTIVPASSLPLSEKEFTATICWMDNKAFQKGQKLLLQQNSFTTKASLKEIIGKIDIHTNEQVDGENTFQLNDIGLVSLKTAEYLSYDRYSQNRTTGSFILIDENTNNTVAAGVLN
jgi:sulfate adenylyltransferase subunit 1